VLTLDELKREAKSHGYKLIPIVPYVKLEPCKCGRKRGAKQWFCTDGSNVTFYRCDYCGLEAPGAKTEREARINWNKMVAEVESEI
jgi:hypothetical protein